MYVYHDIDIKMKTMCFNHHDAGSGFLIYEYSWDMMTSAHGNAFRNTCLCEGSPLAWISASKRL